MVPETAPPVPTVPAAVVSVTDTAGVADPTDPAVVTEEVGTASVTDADPEKADGSANDGCDADVVAVSAAVAVAASCVIVLMPVDTDGAAGSWNPTLWAPKCSCEEVAVLKKT